MGALNGLLVQRFFIDAAPPAAAAPRGREVSVSASTRFCAGVIAAALAAIRPVVMASGGTLTMLAGTAPSWTNGGTSETLSHVSFWDNATAGEDSRVCSARVDSGVGVGERVYAADSDVGDHSAGCLALWR